MTGRKRKKLEGEKECKMKETGRSVVEHNERDKERDKIKRNKTEVEVDMCS